MSSLTAKSGHRDELAAILAGASEGLPGCRSYVVALDTSRDHMIWVTEVWESKELHEASLKTPKVMDAIRFVPESGHSGAYRPMSALCQEQTLQLPPPIRIARRLNMYPSVPALRDCFA